MATVPPTPPMRETNTVAAFNRRCPSSPKPADPELPLVAFAFVGVSSEGMASGKVEGITPCAVVEKCYSTIGFVQWFDTVLNLRRSAA